METIYIYNGESRISVPVTDSAERSHSLQQHNYVKLVWKSAENTPISANAYIEYEGQVFYCLDEYFPTHKEGIYEYDIEFHAIEDTFNRPLFFRYVDILDQTTGETTSWKEIEWSLNGNLRTIAEIVVDSLNRAYDNAYFALPNDSYADTLLQSYSFASNSIADALSTIAEQNETEWWLETTNEYVDGKRNYILHFDKCELGDTIELNDNYTEDANGVWQSGGLKSVLQSGNTNIIPQKLYVYGSERNIIKKTVEQQVEGGVMNVSYDKKLRLPKLFPSDITGANGAIYENKTLGLTITLNEDSSLSIGGINNYFEQVKIFDEVYPKMNMEVTAVSVQNPNSENPIYWLKGDRLTSITDEAPVDGSINPGKLGLLIEGCTLMCTFTSGLLNGREFECAWRESSAEIGLIPIDENDVQIPSGVFKPQEGDTFILWNLAMPQSSITIAQKELCVEAINYIEELATSITETDCTTEAEATRISGLNTKIKVGQRISVNSNVFRNGRLSSRIIKFSYKLTKPYDISFTLASSRQTGRLATLQNLIADVTHEVHSVGQVQRAISRRQWHDTEEMMSMLDSIQKQMVVVGDENNSFSTTCNVAYNDTNKELFISKGYLQHQSYTDNEWKGAWLIAENTTKYMPAIDEKGTTPFYVYFVCSKNNNTGYAEIGSALPQYNDNYVFVLGILSSEFEGKRIFNQSSGLTSIAGGTITTDVVQDPGRRLIIDYSNATIIARNGATIKGAIEFEKGEGENDLGTAIEDLLSGVQGAQNTATNVQNAINNLKIGGVNLVPFNDIMLWNGTQIRNRPTITITANSSYKGGIYLFDDNVKLNTDYVLSFKLKKVSGNILYLGGYLGTATIEMYVDGVLKTGTFVNGISFPNDTNEHSVVINFKQSAAAGEGKLFIQPNRAHFQYAYSCVFSDIQLEQGTKATSYKPNDADRIEARENILKGAMMVDTSKGVPVAIQLVKNIKANVEYVFSVENAILSNDTQSNLYIFDSEYNTIEILNVETNNVSHKIVTFNNNYSSIYLYSEPDLGTFIGVKLAEGNIYGGWSGTPEEEQALMAVSSAMKGSTDIIGGLMLTNLIGMKREDNTIQAGISGLSDYDRLRFWAGASWDNATKAPFRVYDDGRVFGTLFYGYEAFYYINSSNIADCLNNGLLKLDELGSRIVLDLTSYNGIIQLPNDIKYLGTTVEILNIGNIKLAFCNAMPDPKYCSIDNMFEEPSEVGLTGYYNTSHYWKMCKSSCSQNNGDDALFLKFKCIAIPLGSPGFTSEINPNYAQNPTYYTTHKKVGGVSFKLVWIREQRIERINNQGV